MSCIFSKEVFFTFWEMEVSSLWISFLYFLKKKNLIFQEIELFEKPSYISGWYFQSSKNKKNTLNFFSYFEKWNFLAPRLKYFQKWNFLAPGLKSYYTFSKKSFSYTSGETSKARKTEIYYTSPKQAMNKCF